MNTAECWKIVRASLPSYEVAEIEESRPETLAEYVAAAERVRDRERTHEPAWTLWRDTLSAWARTQTDAREVLRSLTKLDRRLGAWCSCAVARTALQRVPGGENRPIAAIETAERWVRGQATEEECRIAATAARDGWTSATNTYADAADFSESAYAYVYLAAARAANISDSSAAANTAADVAATVGVAYADACIEFTSEWSKSLDRRLLELCFVAADAVVTMPWNAVAE